MAGFEVTPEGDVRAQSVFGEWQRRKLDHNGSPIKCYARLLASLGPDATLRPELFRSPCQRMRLLVHERFRPVMDPGINQADVAMRTRDHQRGAGRFPKRCCWFSLTLSEVVPAVTIYGQVTIFRQ